MPLVMNALKEENQVRVGGNTFTFKPGQIKEIYNHNIADFIVRDKAEFGFVGLPEELTYMIHIKDEKQIDPEHKKIVEDARAKGVSAYVRRLRSLVHNAQVSLKRDIDQADLKQDVRTLWSDGEIAHLEQLAKYQLANEDADQAKIDRIKQLEAKLLKG